MLQLIESARPDGIIHLGDGARDAINVHHCYPEIPFYHVYGNCDGFPPDNLLVKEIELQGKRILFSHGHVWQVKSGLAKAVLAARQSNADILLYGHTHIPVAHEASGLWVMNPGPATDCYGKITIDDQGILCEICAYA